MDNLEKSLFVVKNLTKDNLREFSASRAKNWAKLCHNLRKKENLDDFVNIFEIDKCFGVADEEQEKDTESDEFEADVDEDSSIEKDDSSLNISAIEKNLTASNAQSVLAAIAENPNATGIVIEDREFLERTLPFFETFNREIREDGFQQLLDTFDERKIGKMLRPKINYDISPYDRRVNFLLAGGPQCMRNNTYTDTDSDSVDEARYVRSTKRERDINKRYEITTTTIKSFCSVRNRRDKLRRKYADNMPDKTMQDFKNCHVAGHKSWAGLHSCLQHSVDENRIAHKSQNMPKSHQRFYGHSSLSSCSNLDEHEFLSYNGHFAGRRKRALPCRCINCRFYTNGHCVDMSQSSPYHSNAYALQSYHSCYNDGLPFVRESECSCQGVNRLCNNARHLANSSTDDWLVENYDSSESTKATKEANETKTRKKRLQIEDQHSWLKNRKQQKAEEKSSSEDFTEKTNPHKIERKPNNLTESSEREVKLDKPEKSKKSITKTSKTNEKVKDKKNAANSNIKTKSRTGKTKPTNNDEIHKSLQKSFTDDSFERQLQLAIKASEDLYVEELKRSNLKKSENTENNKPLRKATKKNVSLQEEPKQVWNKKKSAANLSEISSESESKENTNREIKEKLENKQRNKRANVKAFSNLDFEENKNAAISAEGKQKIHEAFNKKKKLTKSKHLETSNSAKSKEFVKEKRSMLSNSIKDMSVDNETLKPNDHTSSYSNLKLHKLHIGDDSSTDSTDVNSSVVKMKLPNVTVTATSRSANNINENTTFFSNSDQICNSTAIVNPIARPRQLLSKMKRANTAAAVSTIVNSCELPSTSKAARNANEMSQVLQRDLNSPATDSDSSDCKQVTSTTEKEKSPHIVLYTPQDTTLVPKSSFVNDKYRLTLEHLGSVIGQKYAIIFFRYYRGKCEFKLSSTVHYIPPKKGYYSGNDTSEDDIDIFDVPDIGKIVEERIQ